MKTLCTLLVTMLVAGGSAALAATITLRGECRPAGAVVTLGDLAEITSADSEVAARLKAIELMPAPAAGSRRTVRTREIQDALEAQGVKLIEHRLSGATLVTINGTAPVAAIKPARVTTMMTRTAEKALRDAILLHLQETASADEPWEIDPQPSEEAIRLVSNASGTISVSGGAAPWTGPQIFTVIATGPTGTAQANVTTKVSLPPAIVVATRNISKGTLLRAGDVKSQRTTGRASGVDVAQRIEDVLGRETGRALAEGQSIENSFLRQPLLVKKGEAVTVYARTGGVQVRTTARVKEDGALGDVVTVETLLDRKTFLARVSAPQEVEVFAKGVTTAATPADDSPTVARRNGTTR